MKNILLILALIPFIGILSCEKNESYDDYLSDVAYNKEVEDYIVPPRLG